MSRLDRERSHLRRIHPALGHAADLLIDQGWSCSALLRDMCDLALAATHKRPEPKTQHPEQVRQLLNLYTSAVEGTAPFTDLLGALYMSVAVSTSQQNCMGQFFTPEHIAYLMAQMAMPEPSHACVTGRLVKVAEPSCGSGVMVLQACRWIVASGGRDALKRYAFWANDLDALCARICAVQLMAQDSIHQMPFGELMVTCGDALMPSAPREALLHASHAPEQAVLAQAA